MFRVFGIAALIGALTTVLYFGPFSPAVAVVAVGISFFGMGDDRGFGAGLVVVMSLAYVALTIAVSVGAVPDAGVIPTRQLPVPTQLFLVAMGLVFFIASLIQARWSR